ncbi:hypothetical protein BV22DRAFT_1046689 [Leucogyrophana mollusca]|uniref:Uncharacterized protein n=1 Tax=Leucogyrophana mollusca TaxID=85980 RepID=A0ACB8BIR3_9AGAM|nr:hypothetical protein BV22DRAFT_1046689 [Leucogyrophana mollusca]
MASSSSAPVYVDDRDPTLSYSGVWFTGTFTSDYQNSSHGTNTAGSSVSFSFTGTQVSVYGSVDPSNSVCISSPISTYMVDNTSVTTYFALATETKLSNCLFFESPVLEGGLHSLVITSASQNGLFWFDYIQYTPSDSAPTTNTGSIIGGAVGGVLLLAIIVSLSIFAMRRKRLQGSLFPAIREGTPARE